ncbi:hypothetical protein [Aeromicrobium sp. UC242_57]|uniref:hypothetical protein n=1 Tax=Aeromicrobium sp. UC242_57 TaxID=3374624 RepID=UPI0037984FC1
MRRLVVLLCLLALPACAVPHERSDLAPEKTAARSADVEQIFERYTEVRNAAAGCSTPSPCRPSRAARSSRSTPAPSRSPNGWPRAREVMCRRLTSWRC